VPRVARERFPCRRATRSCRCAARGGAYAAARTCARPDAAACRLSPQPSRRSAAVSRASRWPTRGFGGARAVCALPGPPVDLGGRPSSSGPGGLGRRRLPVRPCPRRSALPSPRTVGCADAPAVRGGPVPGFASLTPVAGVMGAACRVRPPSVAGLPRPWLPLRLPGASRVPPGAGVRHRSGLPRACRVAPRLPRASWTPADPRGSPPDAPAVQASEA
jgi:hypothetical protein